LIQNGAVKNQRSMETAMIFFFNWLSKSPKNTNKDGIIVPAKARYDIIFNKEFFMILQFQDIF
jgi:hypothetical protein